MIEEEAQVGPMSLHLMVAVNIILVLIVEFTKNELTMLFNKYNIF